MAHNSLLHVMDSTLWNSLCAIVASIYMCDTELAFESPWSEQSWKCTALLSHQTFNENVFNSYLLSLHIKLQPVSSCGNNNKVLWSKQNVIKSVFSRLTRDDSSSFRLAKMRGVRFSDDLYGSDILPSFKTARGFTKLVSASSHLAMIDQDLINAQLQFDASCKLAYKSDPLLFIIAKMADDMSIDRKPFWPSIGFCMSSVSDSSSGPWCMDQESYSTLDSILYEMTTKHAR